MIEFYNSFKCGGELEMNFELEECVLKIVVLEYDDLFFLWGEIFVNNIFKMEVVVIGNVGVSGKLEKMFDLIIINIRLFGFVVECLDNIFVYSEMVYDDSFL